MTDEPENQTVLYKGFNPDWTCRGYQYEIGKTYTHEGRVSLCEIGFHACPMPLSVVCYYAPGQSVFAEVEVGGMVRTGDDKVAASTLTVKGEVGLPGLIKAQVEWVRRRIGSKSATTGYASPSATTGVRSPSATTGVRSPSATTGYDSPSATTGDASPSATTGDDSPSAALGPFAKVKVSGQRCPLFAVEYSNNGECIGYAHGWGGRDGIKLDTWYRCENSKLVECESPA
ncbi:MAG: hypothetical protein WBF53_06385 [Litorimonas sp.]